MFGSIVLLKSTGGVYSKPINRLPSNFGVNVPPKTVRSGKSNNSSCCGPPVGKPTLSDWSSLSAPTV